METDPVPPPPAPIVPRPAGAAWIRPGAGSGSGTRDALAANVRGLRRARGWSVRELSARTGVSKALLSAIERAGANPTIEILSRLADVLELPAGDLLRARLAAPEIIRAGELPPAPDDETAVHLLFASYERARFELYRSALPAHARSHRSAHGPGSVEYVLVLRGRVDLVVGDTVHSLDEGDAARFDSGEEHHYATGRSGAATHTLITYPD